MHPTFQRAVAHARLLASAPQLPWRYFVASPYAPLLTQVVVTRRCNLKCAYCNEYDRHSAPVPRERIERTIDRVAALHTRALAFTGGEPTLHPELPALVAHAAARIAKVSITTNGYKLNLPLVEALGDAGLSRMQLSMDGLHPTEVTAKVWRCTESKLLLLAEHARFAVHINAVLGAIPFAETLEVVRRARSLGFETTVQWLHDGDGQVLNPHGVTPDQIAELLDEAALPRHHGAEVTRAGLAPQGWKCRAGARYLYVDEFSVARLCSQNRDAWSCDVDSLTSDHLRANFEAPKACAPKCTLGCVHDASRWDRWRPQSGEPVPQAP